MTFHNDGLLDEIGWHILHELQQEARLSFHELGRRVGLSAPAAAERVRKMEDTGIIQGYRAQVDPHKVGRPITAIIRMTTLRMPLPQEEELTRNIPELLECYRITGPDSYFLKVIVTSIPHLEQVIDRLVPYGEPATSIVLSSLVLEKVVRRP